MNTTYIIVALAMVAWAIVALPIILIGLAAR